MVSGYIPKHMSNDRQTQGWYRTLGATTKITLAELSTQELDPSYIDTVKYQS